MTQRADKYPDLDTMLAYLEERLPTADRLAFEQQLSDDPALEDDLEELKLALQNPDGKERLLAHRSAVDKALSKQGRTTRRSMRPAWLAMAASLLLLSAFAFWISTNQNSLQPSDYIAWQEAPTLRSEGDSELAKAFEAGIHGDWAKAASLFDEQEGNYIQGLPAESWEGRALFMADEKTKAIEHFTKAIDNQDILPQSRLEITGYRAAAYIALNNCKEAQQDLDFLTKESVGKKDAKLDILKKMFAKKCK